MVDKDKSDDFEILKTRLGLKCVNRRKFLKLSQTALCELLGFQSSNFLSRVENGHENVSFKTLFHLAKVLKLRPFEMFLFNDVTELNKADKLLDLNSIINNLKEDDVDLMLNLGISLLKKYN